jgi:hypothetical protein
MSEPIEAVGRRYTIYCFVQGQINVTVGHVGHGESYIVAVATKMMFYSGECELNRVKIW